MRVVPTSFVGLRSRQSKEIVVRTFGVVSWRVVNVFKLFTRDIHSDSTGRDKGSDKQSRCLHSQEVQ